jgi:hypothetical protein
MNEVFFHGRGREAAWSPDLLLTFQIAPGAPLCGLILDAKYTKRLNDTHWSGVRKYFQIRRIVDGRQAIDQVWLSAPGVDGIRFDDDSISWTAAGPDLRLKTGIIQGEIGILPTSGRKPGDAVPLVLEFLAGLFARAEIALPEIANLRYERSDDAFDLLRRSNDSILVHDFVLQHRAKPRTGNVGDGDEHLQVIFRRPPT